MSDTPKARRKRETWILAGLALLSCLFAVLTYYEVLLFAETWRARQNVFIQLKMSLRLLVVVALTVGSAAGPLFAAYRSLVRRFRSASMERDR